MLPNRQPMQTHPNTTNENKCMQTTPRCKRTQNATYATRAGRTNAGPASRRNQCRAGRGRANHKADEQAESMLVGWRAGRTNAGGRASDGACETWYNILTLHSTLELIAGYGQT